MTEINLIGGFYKSKTLPWSAQDVVNWLPVKSLSGGTRSPYKLRGAPGLAGMNPPVVVITELSLSGNAPDTQVGATYSYTYTAAGGTPPYTFSLLSGTLPDGLSLSSAGVITGTPTTVEVDSFVVAVYDSQGLSRERPDTISVIAPGIAWLASDTGGLAVGNARVPVPAGTASGDLLIYLAIAKEGTSNSTLVPDADAITNLGGDVLLSGVGNFTYVALTATADNVANGISVAVPGAFPDARGEFLVYKVPASLYYKPPSGIASIGVSDRTVVSPTNPLTPTNVSPPFTSDDCLVFAMATGSTSVTLSDYPLPLGQNEVVLDTARFRVCFNIIPTVNPVTCGTWAASGTVSLQYLGLNVIRGTG